MNINPEDVIELRRLARISKHQSDDRLVDFHRKAVAALLDQRDGERVRRLAYRLRLLKRSLLLLLQ